MDIHIKQSIKYQGGDWWKWSVWIEGNEDDLKRIEKVTYMLHRTFPNPVRTVTQRASGFRLNGSGWGEFTIHAVVVNADGQSHKLHMSWNSDIPMARERPCKD